MIRIAPDQYYIRPTVGSHCVIRIDRTHIYTYNDYSTIRIYIKQLYKTHINMLLGCGHVLSKISNIIPESLNINKAALINTIVSYCRTTSFPIALANIPAAKKLDNILYWILGSLEKKKTKEVQHQTKIRDKYKLLAEQMAKEIAKDQNGNKNNIQQ